MTPVEQLSIVNPVAERTLQLTQLILWSDWQEVFPQNWKRISNRKLNEACEQVEVIYDLDFEFETLFDAAGQSLFFVDMYYDSSQQRLRQGENSLVLKKKKSFIPDTTISREEYWFEGTQIKTLGDFIQRFAELNGPTLVWKPKVWKTLDELKKAIIAYSASN